MWYFPPLPRHTSLINLFTPYLLGMRIWRCNQPKDVVLSTGETFPALTNRRMWCAGRTLFLHFLYCWVSFDRADQGGGGGGNHLLEAICIGNKQNLSKGGVRTPLTPPLDLPLQDGLSCEIPLNPEQCLSNKKHHMHLYTFADFMHNCVI